MDKTSLVASDLEAGRHFVAALERAGLPIAVAMWFRKVSSDQWMLGIATPEVQRSGPLSVIRFADALRRDLPTVLIPSEQITYFNTSNQFFRDISFPKEEIRDDILTIESFNLNGTEIEKALVFHAAGRPQPSRDMPKTKGSNTSKPDRAA